MNDIFIGGVRRVRCPKCGATYAETTKKGHKSCPKCGYDIFEEEIDRVIKEITKSGSPLLVKK